ncbi:hypothetical protein SELMODRAFT_445160 [Selaginella moellendorffii]|uniref:Uncharacterized protein n=1 Tax=Selaginella moellendorffii TaxID=88036 RepID=D8SGA3_SELML|nr:hypothetical protein SELMODRAFT_445160 [Selaginella moellendorffii]
MVLWEITLATAYCLGLKRTYRLVLRLQRRLLSKHPRIRAFVFRRARGIFDVALRVHRTVQQRDIDAGKSVGNRVLRFLDRLRPSANIRKHDAPENNATKSNQPDEPARKNQCRSSSSGGGGQKSNVNFVQLSTTTLYGSHAGLSRFSSKINNKPSPKDPTLDALLSLRDRKPEKAQRRHQEKREKRFSAGMAKFKEGKSAMWMLVLILVIFLYFSIQTAAREENISSVHYCFGDDECSVGCSCVYYLRSYGRCLSGVEKEQALLAKNALKLKIKSPLPDLGKY